MWAKGMIWNGERVFVRSLIQIRFVCALCVLRCANIFVCGMLFGCT